MKPFDRGALLSVALLLAPLCWDASGLDLALARAIGNARGFSFRNDWWLTAVMHDAMRYLAWSAVVLLSALVVWPIGPFERLPFMRRLQLPAVALLSIAAISSLKAFSATSCPWDLVDFGGVARHVSHWSGWVSSDGGSGHCFPAGHAASGFAFAGGWFAWREQLPGLAAWWLGIAMLLGFSFGITQQLRGAHFMSHTLWTSWICWMVGWLSDSLFARAKAENPA